MKNQASGPSSAKNKFSFIWSLRKGLSEGSFEKFFKRLSRGSFPLFAAMIAALLWGNLSTEGYKAFWHTEVSIAFGGLHLEKSLVYWIDEARMTLFFFLVALVLANLLWINKPLVYMVLGVGLWLAFLGSAIHATIAGVIVAMCIPARGKYDTTTFINNIRKHLDDFQCESDECGYSILLNKTHLNAVHNIELSCHEGETPLQRFEYSLQSWVAFLILPLFALANSGVAFGRMDIGPVMTDSIMHGIVLGLVVGKPVGIFLFTFLAAKLVNAPLIGGVKWRHLLGASMLGGIGFTMSIFISGLSFPEGQMTEIAKLGIIVGSFISGVMGLVVLALTGRGKR